VKELDHRDEGEVKRFFERIWMVDIKLGFERGFNLKIYCMSDLALK